MSFASCLASRELSSISTEVELSNRFSVLDSLEPESDAPSNSVSEPKRRKKILLLGSSHGRGISQRLQASLGEKYAVTSFFKPNASLSNVVGDLSALAKDLDKEDHSVNLRIDLAQLERDMAHINIIDTSSIVREEYTNYGLHLNSRGKDSLTRLIADSLQCDHDKCDNKIPVVIRHRACPFLGSLQPKESMYHSCFGNPLPQGSLNGSRRKSSPEKVCPGFCDDAGEMSPGSSTESYPAFARIGLRENPGKNLNQVTCPDRDSNPGHLVSRPDALTVTPQMKTNCSAERSFSTLKRLKDYHEQQRQKKNLATWQFHIESDITRTLDYEDVINTFTERGARRRTFWDILVMIGERLKAVIKASDGISTSANIQPFRLKKSEIVELPSTKAYPAGKVPIKERKVKDLRKSLMLAGSEFQSLGRAIVKEDEYEEVRWDGIVSIVSWRERVFRLWWEERSAFQQRLQVLPAAILKPISQPSQVATGFSDRSRSRLEMKQTWLFNLA
ncbi:hypothetical protein ANN_14287 [Periplaneta americana]|uniref:Uncharacterized protein n=1 Tax=Periplaneta americana TaxID=6978 RepID=A0ABQ8SY13_PERAM|nr:hypothetical protein ANN_14287 [Periplaneta americana]